MKTRLIGALIVLLPAISTSAVRLPRTWRGGYTN
jgi:hypothetical protein